MEDVVELSLHKGNSKVYVPKRRGRFGGWYSLTPNGIPRSRITNKDDYMSNKRPTA